MNDIERFYLAMGFLDCLQMYAQATPKPEQAITKRMYIQEKMIPDLLPHVPKELILKMIDDIEQEKFAELMVIKYIKPHVEMDRMLDVLKRSQFTTYKDLI